jgi:hypothetical protein
LGKQRCFGPIGLGNHHQAGRVFVEAMDKTGPVATGDVDLRSVMDERIDERALRVP